MTRLLLVRHGMCDPVGRSIAGRAPGVHLNLEGLAQAEALAGVLAGEGLDAVYSSPLERARETAAALARGRGLPVRETAGLTEIDFGAWTGRTIADLDRDPGWQAFNARRAATRIPGGERMDEVIHRATTALERIAQAHPGQLVAAVTHGDVIRGVLTRYLGMPIDLMLRLEAAPGSVSTVEIGGRAPQVHGVNWLPGGPV